VVSAFAPTVPKDLLDQLAVGGRLIIPVGPRYEQNLLKVTKKEHDTAIQDLGPCRWVPPIGDAAWSGEHTWPECTRA
jgi:protein-L-isoaspartate(D-aspartate) O-methyltransferase